jgi:coenzyme F420-reducing hydrogenase delta subunit/ferredoxin
MTSRMGQNEPRSGDANAQPLMSLDGEAVVLPGLEAAEPPEGLLRGLEKFFLYLDRGIGRVVPDSLNPLQHTGAIAVVTFLIATVTGIVLLIWYRPSVHLAHQSVEMMSAHPYTAGLLRSLHRYSSDATVFFALVHAIRFFLERRFGGARWLAWVTGLVMMAVLWLIGWTGYWLVWDLRAQLVAIGTARVVDVLPVFVDPLARSFVTDEGVNSLLFFVVFFCHMLIPLAMGVTMWLHITRLARPKFLTTRPMTLWVMGSLLLLCVIYPATSAEPARMATIAPSMTMDWWFLAPLALTDRMSGGALWGVILVSGAFLFSIPWWLAGKRATPANVVVSRCNECTKCYNDCPYGAIEMVARTDGNPNYLTEASVDESKCVACGICAGSCDTAGIGVDWLSSIEQRRRIEQWLKEASAVGESVHLAFSCAEASGAGLDIDTETGRCAQLPGYRILEVPCAGWVHPLMVERAFRHGASAVLIAACGPGECHYREGATWERDRLAGSRAPILRTEKVDVSQVSFLELDRTRTSELIARARAMHTGEPSKSIPKASPALTMAAAALLAVVSAGIMGFVSDLGYATPIVDGSELVVSFKHPGHVRERCRDLSEEEIEARPIHMRQAQECERGRAPVRLLVEIDGEQVVRREFAPTGLWEDGSSVAVERVPVEPGSHEVRVAIGDSSQADEWKFRDSRKLEFSTDARRVVVFDRMNGFSWH